MSALATAGFTMRRLSSPATFPSDDPLEERNVKKSHQERRAQICTPHQNCFTTLASSEKSWLSLSDIGSW